MELQVFHALATVHTLYLVASRAKAAGCRFTKSRMGPCPCCDSTSAQWNVTPSSHAWALMIVYALCVTYNDYSMPVLGRPCRLSKYHILRVTDAVKLSCYSMLYPVSTSDVAWLKQCSSPYAPL